MSGLRGAVPAEGSRVMLGLTAVTVIGGWVSEGGAVVEVLMPSGHTMLCLPGMLFDPMAPSWAQPTGH
ncbi:hypothetical protein Q6348_08130 [Isoptericola sp. b441]|uniref:Uncharacterized protein n=1 Tax=Actinotalea lenta TaxID=3064654 RepID=A0ABT9D8E6_9CELL|nr:hypothetical protein [Isoptericola sp. b441]MDO8107163.1 hypothetical protein [Isoptericola sp. b441]